MTLKCNEPRAGVFLVSHANGRFYVGATTNLYNAWHMCLGKLRANNWQACDIQAAYNENPDVEFHYEFTADKAQADEIKQQLLDIYNAECPGVLFNRGKSATSPLSGRLLSDEHKRAIGEAAKRRMAEPHHCAKVIRAMTTEEAKAKRMATLLSPEWRASQRDNYKRFAPTITVNGVQYIGYSAAGRGLKLPISTVRYRVLSDRYKWRHWKIVEEIRS